MTHRRFVAVLLAAVLFAAPVSAQDRPSSIRLFLDCDRKLFDLEFIRSEITLVDFVRDRTDSDVHLLITSEGTASVWTTENTMRSPSLVWRQRMSFGIHSVSMSMPPSRGAQEGITDG